MSQEQPEKNGKKTKKKKGTKIYPSNIEVEHRVFGELKTVSLNSVNMP